jgi:hypothetical protein
MRGGCRRCDDLWRLDSIAAPIVVLVCLGKDAVAEVVCDLEVGGSAGELDHGCGPILVDAVLSKPAEPSFANIGHPGKERGQRSEEAR